MVVSYRDAVVAQNPTVSEQDGCSVEFFYEVDLGDVMAAYIWKDIGASSGHPRLLQSHGWLAGTLLGCPLEEAMAAKESTPAKRFKVLPQQDLPMADRRGQRRQPLPALYVPASRLRRQAHERPPLLSMVFVRWGGKHIIGQGQLSEDPSDGGWGPFGSPTCDWYMAALVREGLLTHPLVGAGASTKDRDDEAACASARSFELFSLFVGNSVEAADVKSLAPTIAKCLKGLKKASFWMLWPSEWEDYEESDYAGYVQCQPYFAAMRACQAAGIRSSFPHPAAQYELITSKTWLTTLAPDPRAALPAAVLVEQDEVLKDPLQAAKQALARLEVLRASNPLPKGPKGQASPSAINKAGIKKGVVKLGNSWEARFVFSFVGVKQLALKLQEMLLVEGCLATTCIVQEWVDFDFEIRLFFLPPADWTPDTALQPVRFEYNGWSKSDNDKPGGFLKLNKEKCLQTWSQDEQALTMAQAQAVEVSQFLLQWICEQDPQPVPMLRLDFMVLRLGAGQARVVFGEYCEMGACCISWREGPPIIWRAALDYALR